MTTKNSLADTLIGHVLGNFKIERLIGRGGMGQVYFGTDLKLQRPVAIKVLDARYRDNPTYAQRFVREAQTVASWRHDNILQVYYADEQDGLYYFAMEYIDGADLDKILDDHSRQGQTMPHDEVLRIGRAVAQALDYAHKKGIIHRDVKPSNVMIASDGRIVLADFGLALDTEHGTLGEVFGSAHYIAPEQAQKSSRAVPQSDLYSLGIILYRMLTGIVPFDDPSPVSVLLQHTTRSPTSPRQINSALNTQTETVLLKALKKSPQQRYQSGYALINALEKALQTDSPVSSSEQTRRRVWPLLAGCGLIALASIIIILGMLILSNKQNDAVSTLPPSTAIAPKHILHLPFVASEKTKDVDSKSPLLTPTIAYQGQRFVVHYDENGFYLFNDSDSDKRVNPLAFERLDGSGVPLNRFNGSQWARYYPVIRPDHCMRIEISSSGPYLRPAECKNQYDSTLSFGHGNKSIFWSVQPGSQQFRVLWNEQEIARCEIDAGVCEMFLP